MKNREETDGKWRLKRNKSWGRNRVEFKLYVDGANNISKV